MSSSAYYTPSGARFYAEHMQKMSQVESRRPLIRGENALCVAQKASLQLREGWKAESLPSGAFYLVDTQSNAAHRLPWGHDLMDLLELDCMQLDIMESDDYSGFHIPENITLPVEWKTDNSSGKDIYTDTRTGNIYHDHPALLFAANAECMSEPSDWEPRFRYDDNGDLYLSYFHRYLDVSFDILDTFDRNAVSVKENWCPVLVGLNNVFFTNKVTGTMVKQLPWINKDHGPVSPEFVEVRQTTVQGESVPYFIDHLHKSTSWTHPVVTDAVLLAQAQQNTAADNEAFEMVVSKLAKRSEQAKL